MRSIFFFFKAPARVVNIFCFINRNSAVCVLVIQNSVTGSKGESKTDGLYEHGLKPRWRQTKLDIFDDDNYRELVTNLLRLGDLPSSELSRLEG